MATEDKTKEEKDTTAQNEGAENQTSQEQEATEKSAAEDAATDNETSEDAKNEEVSMDKIQADLEEAKDKYLRLYSDFENFRRRTSKERLELVKTAGEDIIRDLLPILDDFERAIKSFDNENQDLTSVKEGVALIQNKMVNTLKSKGLKEMEDPVGKEFDSEYHEAVTQIPAPEEKLKGKVVDVIEKGYMLENKVVRFAKVVTGA